MSTKIVDPEYAAFEKKLLEEHRIGQEILEKLFVLNSDQLKSFLQDVAKDKISDWDYFNKHANVYKSLKNDIPESITVADWDRFGINWAGISFTTEHGNPECIVNFDKFFKLV